MDKYPEADDPYRRRFAVRETSTGFLYRGKGYCCGLPSAWLFGTQNAPFIQQMQASVSYVTGAHAMKVGFQNDFGTSNSAQLRQRVRAVLHVQQRRAEFDRAARAAVHASTTHLSLDIGIYAQDKWTFKRATINGGVRFDFFKNKLPRAAPRAHLVRAEPQRHDSRRLTYANLKDITPRRRGGLRSVRRRQDVAQDQLGQVHDRPQPAGPATRSRCSPTPRTAAGRPACRSGIRTTTRRSAI